MNKKIFKKIIASSLLVFAFFVFSSVSTYAVGPDADVKEKTSSKLDTPTGPGTSAKQPLITCGNDGNECTVKDFFNLIQSVINLVFMLAGFVVAGMFMYAGFLMITASGNASQIQKAKTIFRRVVIGFLIMFASYLLVKNLLKHLELNDSVKSLFMNLIQ